MPTGVYKHNNFGDKNHKWRGDNVGYYALHSWLYRCFGKANKCEKCSTKTAKRYEWANVSGEYKRVREDWIQLCTSCHHKLDDVQNKGWITKKGKM